MDAKTSTEILRREFKTVDKSLGLKPILIDLANDIADFIEQQDQQLQQSQHRERVLQEKLDKIQETHTDNEGYVWEAPTSYAYAMACKALHEHTNKERVLREALQTIFNATSKRDYSTNEFNTVHKYAREALEASR